MKKRVCFFIALSITLLLGTVSAKEPDSTTKSGKYPTVHSEEKIPIIAWHGIPDAKSAELFPLMKEAGIDIYLGKYNDESTMLNMLNIAQQADVKLITSCPELKSRPEATVQSMMKHPALYGYYLKDEPEVWDLADLGVWTREIQRIDNEHPCYINLYPNWAWGNERYTAYVDSFLRQVPVPFVSFDQYPIVEIRNAPSILRSGWYRNLEEIAAAAKEAELPFWAFAMAWSHDLDSIHHYPAPTLPELRLQQFSNLAYGAQALQYFTFRGAVNDEGITPVYERIQTLNREIQNMAGVFLKSKVLSVWHTSPLPDGTRPINKLPRPIKSLTTSGGLLVSHLEKGSNQYLVIVNRDYRNPIKLALSFDNSVRRVMKDGSIQNTAATSTIEIDAGDMIIYTWKK